MLSPRAAHWPEGAVFTVGHSTMPIERFIGLLQAYGVERLVDIRSMPRSRHNPQFEGASLADSLTARRIEYAHIQALGGLRRAHKDSPNTGWRNEAFRGYADYMQGEEFQDALEMLIRMSRQKRAAIMCAEAVPWRCHRSLVADALTCAAYQWSRFYRKAAIACIGSRLSRGLKERELLIHPGKLHYLCSSCSLAS